MNKVQNIILVIALAVFSAQAVAQTEKDNDIRKLMTSMGMADMSNQIKSQLISSIRQSYPDVPARVWDEVSAEVQTKEMIDMMVPIYSKYYTHEEVKDLIKFYNTPVGQKTIQVMPALMQESMSVGQQWGLKLTQIVTEKLKVEGY